MVVGGSREWNEDRGLPGGRDFSYRACSGAADQQVGAREGRGHVVDELVHFAKWSEGRLARLRHAQALVGGENHFVVALARLMNDVNRGNLRAQAGQRLDHGLIDGMRALAASEDRSEERRVGKEGRT